MYVCIIPCFIKQQRIILHAMNRVLLVTYIALISTILAATITSNPVDSWNLQTYEIPEEDKVKADIVRAILAGALQVDHFTDLGITLILSEKPMILSTRNIPDDMFLPSLSAEKLVNASKSSFSQNRLPPNIDALLEQGYVVGFTLMSREMIKTHYYDENGLWRNNETYPVFLEFVHLDIEGANAYAELGCMGYGNPLQAHEWEWLRVLVN